MEPGATENRNGKDSFGLSTKGIVTYQMLVKMKYSWMKTLPTGRTPPIRIPGISFE